MSIDLETYYLIDSLLLTHNVVKQSCWNYPFWCIANLFLLKELITCFEEMWCTFLHLTIKKSMARLLSRIPYQTLRLQIWWSTYLVQFGLFSDLVMHVTVNVIVALKNNFTTENLIKKTDLPQSSLQTICRIYYSIFYY